MFTLTYASLRRGSSNILFGCVSGCVGLEMHLEWCNLISVLRLGGSFFSRGNSSGPKTYIDSPICCAVENAPQEIVFSLLTPPIGNAKVSSTCAAVPFGEVRSHSRVPVCRSSSGKLGIARRSQDIPANRSRCCAQSGGRESNVLSVAPFVNVLRQHSLNALKISGRRKGRFSRLGVNDSDLLG